MTESREASVHALVGAYAIDALDDHEHEQFEGHLAECEDCQAEVASLRETASVLGGAEAIEPPASVRRSVLAGIAGTGTPQETGDPAVGEDPAERPDATVVVLSRRRFQMAAGAVAAAVLIAVGAGAVVVGQLGEEDSQVQAQPTLAERVQEADDAETIGIDLEDGAKATVVRSVAMNRAVLITEDMPPPPEGKVYELWLDDREKGFTPAGLMSTTSDQTLVLQGDAARASRVAVTVEPAQGSRVPTSDPIAVFPFEPTQA